MVKRQHINCSMDDKTMTQLTSLSIKNGITKSEVVRYLINHANDDLNEVNENKALVALKASNLYLADDAEKVADICRNVIADLTYFLDTNFVKDDWKINKNLHKLFLEINSYENTCQKILKKQNEILKEYGMI